MIVDEQKIVSFIKLLDGVPKQEWEVIKRSCDQLYELASFKITPKINDDSGERTPAYRGGSFLLQREQRH